MTATMAREQAASASEKLRPMTGGRPKGIIMARTRLQMDALADVVAESGCTVTQAGAALGMTQQSTSRVWRLICASLGPQAQ